LLDEGAAVDATDDFARWTPLLRAANQRHAEVVRFLLAHGANVNVQAGLGQTPLTEAILGTYFDLGPSGNRDETVQVLLSSGADVNLRGHSGWSPLITAVFMGDADLVRLLISKGADPSAEDRQGRTALIYAEERDEREIIAILKNGQPTTQ
jgi:ankyrin repeat protein